MNGTIDAPRRALTLGIALVLVSLAPAAAATPAGQVIFATGDVTAEREPPVPLAKGDDVLVQDTVRTGSAARAQLLMLDGAKLAIRPDSAIRIEEFVYASEDEEATASAVTSAGGDASVTRLLKGGFRTITGAIGKEADDTYEVRSAVGVLGIRGTDFAILLCGGDCDAADGGEPPEDGLYLGVTEGIIFFRNETGDIELRAGEYAFIPLDTRRPRRLDLPPPALVDPGEPADGARAGASPIAGFDSKLGSRRQPDVTGSRGNDGDADSQAPGGADAPDQPITVLDDDGTPIDITSGESPQRDPQQPPPGNRTISWSSGPLPALQVPGASGVGDNALSDYTLDAGGDLTGFVAPLASLRQGAENATFDIATSANAETGSDTVTLLRWGRWAGGTAGIVPDSGGNADLDLASQSLHWISSPDWMTAPAIPVTGTATYSLVGATSPTDNFGNTGVLGDASLVADFTNQQVTSTLSLTLGQSQWDASGTGVLGPLLDPARAAHLFEGLYDAVSVDGVGGGTGAFSGFFSDEGGSSDPSFPGGAGLTYTLQDAGGQTTVSGAAAFGNP
ncbi:MAG: FecR family protein [Woeseiaceae bacterium]|nr:FecR family protein [Woeseiaceae bacterium]